MVAGDVPPLFVVNAANVATTSSTAFVVAADGPMLGVEVKALVVPSVTLPARSPVNSDRTPTTVSPAVVGVTVIV